jgi:hypothetical protein
MAQATTAQRNAYVAVLTAIDALLPQVKGDPELYRPLQLARRELVAAADVLHARAANDPSLRKNR